MHATELAGLSFFCHKLSQMWVSGKSYLNYSLFLREIDDFQLCFDKQEVVSNRKNVAFVVLPT